MPHPMTKQQEHAARGGRPWMRISRAIRRERPLCELCDKEGRITASELVHHIDHVNRDKDRLLHVAPGRLLSLCRHCHDRVHGRNTRPVIGIDGWPI